MCICYYKLSHCVQSLVFPFLRGGGGGGGTDFFFWGGGGGEGEIPPSVIITVVSCSSSTISLTFMACQRWDRPCSIAEKLQVIACE